MRPHRFGGKSLPAEERRSVAAVGGVLPTLYVATPPAGLEWFPIFLYIKLLVSHLVREEPNSAQPQ